jgi:hypothetical protein
MNILSTSPSCHSCHKDLGLEAGAKVGKSEECPSCYADVRCCKMCHFFDQSCYNECKEPNADRIIEKEKANFCDYFQLLGSGNAGEEKNNLLDAANALFKN